MQTNIFLPEVIAEVQVTYKRNVPADQLIHISNSEDIYKVMISTWDMNTLTYFEEMKVVLLNRANRILGIYPLSKGGTSGTVCDPKIVFSVALKAAASSIILAHNHPSGNLKPSNADLTLTKKLKSAGDMLDLPILDHLIVTDTHYFSFADEGLL